MFGFEKWSLTSQTVVLDEGALNETMDLGNYTQTSLSVELREKVVGGRNRTREEYDEDAAILRRYLYFIEAAYTKKSIYAENDVTKGLDHFVYFNPTEMQPYYMGYVHE
mmetsp:Transcript_28240/g.42743  ORF Transcript_28240/g.42743 Transcript_28240/m.42743 type:complete len:109 (-) Transcript_28240:2336-2662(-)